MSQKIIFDLTALCLLDDSDPNSKNVRLSGPAPRNWNQLTQDQILNTINLLKKHIESQKPVVKTVEIFQKKKKDSVSNDAPSFKQLLNSYNTALERGKLKTSAPLNSTDRTFSSEKIQHIRLPSIPGKILRPK